MTKIWTHQRNSGSRATALLALGCLAIGMFVGGLLMASRLYYVAGATASPISVEAPALATYHQGLSLLYKNVVPSVVRLDVDLTDPSLAEAANEANTSAEEGWPQRGHASGFVWDSSGHILTNYHVVSAARHIQVTFYDGTTAPAKIVGTEQSTDLAMLKVASDSVELQPVILADSSTVQVGDLALAIGVPFGQNFTLSQGIVSAVNRTLQSCANCYPVSPVIQTDTPLHPGNSGGPLFNQQGQVIGIVTWRMNHNKGDAGIGFALSGNVVKQMVPVLLGEDSLGR